MIVSDLFEEGVGVGWIELFVRPHDGYKVVLARKCGDSVFSDR